MKSSRVSNALIPLFICLFLAGCGGGGGSDSQSTPQPQSANIAPTASNANISDNNSGKLIVGAILTANYTYNDANGDDEGESTFRWLRDNAPIHEKAM